MTRTRPATRWPPHVFKRGDLPFCPAALPQDVAFFLLECFGACGEFLVGAGVGLFHPHDLYLGTREPLLAEPAIHNLPILGAPAFHVLDHGGLPT
jgi:hypothetical protein